MEPVAGRGGARTVVVRRPGAAPAALLDTALEQLGADAAVDGGPGGPAVVLVAPAGGLGPDPALVQRLLDRLGAQQLDLGGEREPVAVPGSVLAGVPLPVDWVSGALRVVVTATATDPVEGYLGAASALATLLPDDAAVPRPEAVTDLLRWAPPHLVVLDATAASDGCFGSVRPSPRDTGTVVAGTHPLAADEALAALMGVDPAQSRVVRHALDELGPPPRTTSGGLEPWDGWRPVAPALLAAAQRAAASAAWAERVLHDVASDAPAGDGDVVLRWARGWLGPLVARADDDPTPLVVAVEGVAFWAAVARAWATVLDKSRVPRRAVSLGLDLGRYGPGDYPAVARYLAPLMALADAIAPRADGVRWRRHGSGVLFVAERELDAPYDAFVARVDITRAIRLMNDYIGGTAVVVGRDRKGRVTRQAERNLYLPQPNYLALYGGEAIDVCKLEHVRYADGEQVITWRTVRSPNGTAVHDDGAVVFRAAGPDRTLVRVYGLQQFVLPPFWQVVDLSRWPQLHDALTDDAYRTFFAATLDRFEACYEGRDRPVGREPWVDHLPPTARASQLLSLVGGALAPAPPAGSEPDADGFVHVVPRPSLDLDRPSRPLPGFAAGLRRAVQLDATRDAGP